MSDALTTEKIRKSFKNNFDLCNFSIHIARSLLAEGKHLTLEEILRAVQERALEIES